MNLLLQGVKESENAGGVGLVVVMGMSVKNCGGKSSHEVNKVLSKNKGNEVE